MSTPRPGLGRGLGALLPTRPEVITQRNAAEARGTPVDTQSDEHTPSSTAPAPTDLLFGSAAADPAVIAYYAELEPASISPNPRQPRTNFDAEAHAELVASITEVGLLQPVVVRASGPGRFELVMGERRWRAARAAGLTSIPAIVRRTSDEAMLRDALIENLHRSELNPLEEAAAYQQLLDDFGCTHGELAERLGRSRPQVSNTLRLLGLPAPVQRRVAAGVLSAGHARALLSAPDAAAQERLAERVVAEGLSVRNLEELVALGAGGRRRAARRHTSTAPELAEVETRLGERLETRVRVRSGAAKGSITIEFASLDDLERIVALIAPGRVSVPN